MPEDSNHAVALLPGLTIAIPTFNRAYCLEKTLDSYFCATGVTHILLVIDASEDETEAVFHDISRRHPGVDARCIVHTERQGAAAARQTSVEACRTTFMAFGEDDVMVASDYYSKLLEIVETQGASLASGKIVYLADHADFSQPPRSPGPSSADDHRPWFDLETLTGIPGRTPPDGAPLVFGHALYLGRTAQLRHYGFDPAYRFGTGYREESDTQLMMYLDGLVHRYCATAVCQHLPFSFVKRGGQRTSKWRHWYWNVRLNRYFLRKHHQRLRKLLPLPASAAMMHIRFAAWQWRTLLWRPVYIGMRARLIDQVKRLLGR